MLINSVGRKIKRKKARLCGDEYVSTTNRHTRKKEVQQCDDRNFSNVPSSQMMLVKCCIPNSMVVLIIVASAIIYCIL